MQITELQEAGLETHFVDQVTYVWTQGQNKLYPGGTSQGLSRMYQPVLDGLVTPFEATFSQGRFAFDTYFVEVRYLKIRPPSDP